MNKKIMSNLIAAGVISSAVLLAGCDLDFGGSGSGGSNDVVSQPVDSVFDTVTSTGNAEVTVNGNSELVIPAESATVSSENTEGESVAVVLPTTTTLTDVDGNTIDASQVGVIESTVTMVSNITSLDAGLKDVTDSAADGKEADSDYYSLAVADLSVFAKAALDSTTKTAVSKLSNYADVSMSVTDDSLTGVSSSDLDVWAYVPNSTYLATSDVVDPKRFGIDWIWVKLSLSSNAFSIVNGVLTIKFQTKAPVIFNVTKKIKKKATGTGATGN